MSLTPILAPHTVYAPPSQLLKFAVLGDGFVGKSAITLRFVRNCKVRKHEQCRVYRVCRVCCMSCELCFVKTHFTPQQVCCITGVVVRRPRRWHGGCLSYYAPLCLIRYVFITYFSLLSRPYIQSIFSLCSVNVQCEDFALTLTFTVMFAPLCLPLLCLISSFGRRRWSTSDSALPLFDL